MFAFILDLLSAVTPAFVNPLIFGFRMQEIRSTIVLAFCKVYVIHHQKPFNQGVIAVTENDNLERKKVKIMEHGRTP